MNENDNELGKLTVVCEEDYYSICHDKLDYHRIEVNKGSSRSNLVEISWWNILSEYFDCYVQPKHEDTLGVRHNWVTTKDKSLTDEVLEEAVNKLVLVLSISFLQGDHYCGDTWEEGICL